MKQSNPKISKKNKWFDLEDRNIVFHCHWGLGLERFGEKCNCSTLGVFVCTLTCHANETLCLWLSSLRMKTIDNTERLILVQSKM